MGAKPVFVLLINIDKTIFAKKDDGRMRKKTMPELKRLTVEAFKAADKLPVIVVLDNIRSQNNIGSVFRTADAFRLQEVLLCGITATPPHREIQKTALGATESVAWQYFPTTIEAVTYLLAMGCQVMAVEQTEGSTMLQDFVPDPDASLAIIFGNEVDGIDDEVLKLAKGSLEIPQFGTKHSINISVAVGIVIWDIFDKLEFKKSL
jgi:tRNA G18 (ribose-2'-O)-methylase SpoU